MTASWFNWIGMTWNVYWPTLSTPYLCPATWWESGTQPFRWALCAPSSGNVKHEPVINGHASSSLPIATDESIMMLSWHSHQRLHCNGSLYLLTTVLHARIHVLIARPRSVILMCVWPIACHQSRRPRSRSYNELFTWATSHFLTSEMFTLLPR